MYKQVLNSTTEYFYFKNIFDLLERKWENFEEKFLGIVLRLNIYFFEVTIYYF